MGQGGGRCGGGTGELVCVCWEGCCIEGVMGSVLGCVV